MRTMQRLGAASGIAVDEYRCVDATPGWFPVPPAQELSLVLVRDGAFRRRGPGGELLVDSSTGFFERPDEPQEKSHLTTYDSCTVISVSPDALGGLLDPERTPPGPVFTDASLDLAHRLMVARLRDRVDALDVAESALSLVAAAVGQQAPERVAAGAPRSRSARRALVQSAREAILSDSPAAGDLTELAALLKASPYHLSRIFHDETGVTLSRYRNRLRVRQAMSRIERGERDLARLAVDLGFFDHAHMTRTIKRDVGYTPSRLREMLSSTVDLHPPRVL